MLRGKYKKQNTRVLGDIELNPKSDALVQKKIAEAEEELAKEVRVNFRWRREQLQLVQQAAEKIGIPYQTYVKYVLFKQAVADLQESVLLTHQKKTNRVAEPRHKGIYK